MLGIVIYNLIQFLNYFLTYSIVMNIRFAKKKLSYVVIVASSCMIQNIVNHQMDEVWGSMVPVAISLIGAVILDEYKKWKVLLLYPVVWAMASLVNIFGSYILAAILGITQKQVCDSESLTCVAECTMLVVLFVYGMIRKWKKRDEVRFSAVQYCLLYLGIGSFFVVMAFSQGLIRNEWEALDNMKDEVIIASIVIAFCFMVLSIYQQVIWKKNYEYRMENEKYGLFLTKQEEHIRMLVTEDERWRKLRHDMNAHIVAMDNIVEREDWGELKKYFAQMKDSIEETKIEKYTTISAVDAVIAEWHKRAIEDQVIWSWEGRLMSVERVTIFDLCILFSNLLSNAVEAVRKIEKEKKIQVKVVNFQEQVVLSVGNTCVEQINIRTRPNTTKEDMHFHGLGLRNVEEIVEKNKGSIEYQAKDGWFQVDIVL